MKELMIGDCVFVKSKNKTGVVHEIYARSAHVWCGETYGSVYSDRYDYDDIEPIPLTPEILEKNGFKTNNDHTLTGSCIYRRLYGKWNEYEVVVRLLNGWLEVRSYDERWYDLLEVHFQPRYVHELQHALRLCRLDIIADNFKI